MAIWDSSLPVPLVSGYTVREAPRLLKTSMESGPQRVALFSAHPRIFGSASMVVDQAQAISFNAIFINSRYGASWVDDVPLDTGTGLALHRMRITSVSRSVVKPPDAYWKIAFNFETDERETP